MGELRVACHTKSPTTYCNLTHNPDNITWCVWKMMTELKCTQTQSFIPLPFKLYTSDYIQVPTRSESPTDSFTLGGSHSRHNVVVCGSFLKVPREGDGDGLSLCCRGGITVDQVGIKWVCTIVNGAAVPWLKCAHNKCICYVGWVNIHCKSITATCGEWWTVHVSEC